MRGRALLIPLLCMAVLTAGARPRGGGMVTVRDAGRVPADNSAVTVRHAPMKKIEEFRRDAAYDYDRKEEPLFAFWDYILAWIREKLSPYVKGVSDDYVWKAFEFAVYGIVAAAVILVVVKLIGADVRGLFFSPRRRPASGEEIERIEAIDFDGLIEGSLERKDYRTAVRLLYHKTLKELSIRGIIRWKIEKTNRDYLSELAGSPLRGDFSELTRIFEYIWYGNFDLPADDFAAVRARYEGFCAAVAEGRT